VISVDLEDGHVGVDPISLSGFETYVDKRVKQLLRQNEDIERANPQAFAAAFGERTVPRSENTTHQKPNHWCDFHGKKTNFSRKQKASILVNCNQCFTYVRRQKRASAH
jgi:hypothetical protein